MNEDSGYRERYRVLVYLNSSPQVLHRAMSSDRLTDALDDWYVRAVIASRFLTGFYRSMGDHKQAFRASQAASRSTECAARLNLLERVTTGSKHVVTDHLDDVAVEDAAWRDLVESLAGICAFFGIADGVGGSPARGLAGSRSAFSRDFQTALTGYRTAFPESMLQEGVDQSIAQAALTCAEAVLVGIDPNLSMPDQQVVRMEILESVKQVLLREAHRILNG